ncbi:MAG: phospholipase C, phosphocholine-specific [Chitinophagaceae bacterium]
MDTRRDFIKKAALLSGGAGFLNSLPPSIQKALAIDPKIGSTYLDAEHIVILMQENRSFDHCFGTLQGVRGFNDPRAITKPDKNLVWLQKNEAGEIYIPFRLNMKDTKATWLGSLPHSWTDQVDAGNGGKHDKWLIAKTSGHEGFENTPLTMGYYNREDIPFYYSLADAFTVCDQNFCSSLTGTTPNRLHLWTGTIRGEQNANAQANVSNSDVDYDKEVNWTTFPERLEENGISWKIYQNEISLESGLDGDEDGWLANFTDNPIEWFSQYNIRFSPSYRKYLEKMEPLLPGQVDELEKKLQTLDEASNEAKEVKEQLKSKLSLMLKVAERHQWSAANFEKLSQEDKNLHTKAFSTNSNDPHYRELTTLRYKDGNIEREMKVPKGDVLHQFREDVNSGELPAVSWVVGPANFSDHPGAPWYGAWYVSEVMDILTKKPEVWKKTVFILCYDENDGYFDHVPPYVAPHPSNPASGRVSEGIDASLEFVTMEQDSKRTDQKHARENAIGLGYRVPLVIASPWSRGGAVCSQVFDHTSIIQFVEKFLNNKTGKQIKETNISAWRRAVCGDLSSVFKPYNGEKINKLSVVAKDSFYESIHKAQFKKDPSGFKILTEEEIKKLNKKPSSLSLMPRQEKGTRSSCALPYQLYADGKLSDDKKSIEVYFAAKNEIFGDHSAGSPFNVYAESGGDLIIRNYALVAGSQLKDQWQLGEFQNQEYHLKINGPNGFFREFSGNANDPAISFNFEYARTKSNSKRLTGNVELQVRNFDKDRPFTIEVKDNAYKKGDLKKIIGKAGSGNQQINIVLDLSKSFGWYDFTIRVSGAGVFEKRYAGHVETGEASKTDPLMGDVL